MTATPLAGTLLVDLSRHLPGPLTAKILRDLGARTIKVEEPRRGDPVRSAPPFSGGTSALAAELLAGSESVALDLKSAAARAVAERLLARADVLLSSLRPGKLAELGLAPERLAADYPRLVVCELSGWGGDGPRAPRAGHDLAYQAVAGTLAPTRGMPALPAADLLGAWGAAAAILAALHRRHQRGRGGRLDCSLYDAAVAANFSNRIELAAGTPPAAPGALTGALPCYDVYAGADGQRVALAILEPELWSRFCAAVGRPDLTAHQFRRDAESHRRVAELVAGRDGAAWQRLFDELDLPCERVLDLAAAAAEPQLAARGVVDREGRAGFPARFDGRRPRAAGGCPRLGEQTRAIVREFSPELAELSTRELARRGIGPRRSIGAAIEGLARRLR